MVDIRRHSAHNNARLGLIQAHCAYWNSYQYQSVVDAPGGNGPSNGMYALQKALKQRIAQGLDWLSIKSLPVSKGAMPWFWHWDDRRYAWWCDAEGQPFVQGPNLLFTNSGSPRIDSRGVRPARRCQLPRDVLP